MLVVVVVVVMVVVVVQGGGHAGYTGERERERGEWREREGQRETVGKRETRNREGGRGWRRRWRRLREGWSRDAGELEEWRL